MRFTHITRAKIPTTNWSLIAIAAQPGEAQRKALENLILSYRPALLTFLMLKHKIPKSRAEDLVQGFIADRFLEKNLFARADRNIGKFRNILLTCFENYMRDDHRNTARRQTKLQPLTDHHAQLPATDSDPSQTFQRLFAQNVVRLAVTKMEQACRASRRLDLWIVFEARILRVFLNQQEPVEYQELVQACGFENPTQAMNALVTAKRMYKRILEGIVAEYVATEEEIGPEIDSLLQSLGKQP